MKESQITGAELVIASGDAAELFQFVEEALDVVALTVECLGPAEALLAPDHVGNVADAAASLDVVSQAVGVISLVGDDGCPGAESGQQGLGPN